MEGAWHQAEAAWHQAENHSEKITRSLRYETLSVPRDYLKRGLCQNLFRFLQGGVKTGHGQLESLANSSEGISLN